MRLSGDGRYLEDYDLNQYGRKVQGKCCHCDHEDWFTKRVVEKPQDYVVNKLNLEKLERRMQAHADRTHYPNRFTPTATAGPKPDYGDDPPF